MKPLNEPARAYALKLYAVLALLCLFVLGLAAWSLERSYFTHKSNAEIRTQNFSLLLLDEIARTYDDIDRSLILIANDFQHWNSHGRQDKSFINDRIALALSLHPELIAFLGGTKIFRKTAILEPERGFNYSGIHRR
jgi:hypothetical protein